MRAAGVPESSVMNGGHTAASYAANSKLFALRTELGLLPVTGSATATSVHAFLVKHDAVESFSTFGPRTKNDVVEIYNREHKTRLSLVEFSDLASA
jgi:hypothetical protein